jgi:hypothetical protein
LSRYLKTTLDRQTIVACLIAYGTNVGLGKMGAISDLSHQTLYVGSFAIALLTQLFASCTVSGPRSDSRQHLAPLR